MKRIFIKLIGMYLILNNLFLNVYGDEYKYDNLNRLVEVDYDSGQKCIYEYDKGGNVNKITEIPIITRLELNLENCGMNVGDKCTIVINAVYSNGMKKYITNDVKFNCEDINIARVDENGVITGVNEGVTKVNVVYDGKIQTINVKILSIEDKYDFRTSSTENAIQLTWNKIVNATKYEVEIDGNIIATINTEKYIVKHLGTNTMHTIRVRSIIGNKKSNWSKPITAYTLLVVPNNIKINTLDKKQVIEWDSVEGAESYEVKINKSSTFNTNESKFSAIDLNTNTKYTYMVRAKNKNTTSEWSKEVSKYTLPSEVQNITSVKSNNFIKLSWIPIEGIKKYEVSFDGVSKFVNETSYNKGGLIPNTPHTFKIRAINNSGVSSWSALSEVRTLLTIPKYIKVTSDIDSQIVTWKQVEGATNYEIDCDGKIIDVGNNCKYIVKGLESNTIHRYRVRAKNDSFENYSDWSNFIEKYTMLNIPTLSLKTLNQSAIEIIWNSVDSTQKYYLLVDGKKLDLETNTKFIHNSLTYGTRHIYQIMTSNKNTFSNWSSKLTIYTLPIAPENINASIKRNYINISWKGVRSATEYDVEVDGIVITTVSTSYTQTELNPLTNHKYRVRSRNSSGTSEWSKIYKFKTLK